MGRSSRRKEKHEKVGELPQHDSNEGTSARTRPFNYDEIMSKRNSKKVDEKVESVKEEKDSLIHNDFNFNRYDGGNGQGKEISVGHERHLLGDREKRSSRKKIENADRRNDSISKQKTRENHEPERRLKSEVRKDTDGKDESKYEKQTHVKRKTEKAAGGSENVYAKKHSRDLVERDRHVSRNEGKSERDDKRKHQSRDDEENRERHTTKRHETRKEHASETSDRKEKKDPLRSHHEDSNHKRRRSQSQEREDRHRRSISLSPRLHKRASHHVSEHEISSHGVKVRSGKHSDDRSRMTSNGSSGHHRRHGGSSSGLGGYSPRKRKTEASVRTPSPVHRSTEKRTAKWDLAPAETENMVSGSASTNLQASSQLVSINMHAMVNAVPSVSVIGNPLVVSSAGSLSFDSVQLTEATRPMRRLYVENVPTSASEKAMMESFNNFLLSSGINHIRGTKPCISCIIHKGKGQALVEFLTPEDASAALSFDGSTLSGSILKIRRPKDFVEVTGEPEKSEATVITVNDVVEGSHDKFLEIANAFGPLKAYHFDNNEDLHEQYAILEYVDQFVTHKACAGLNGMKLGGQVITAVQAVLDGFSSGNGGDRNSCIIPQLARPLLQKPTQVLKLKNLHAKSIMANGENKMNDNTRETGTREKLADDKINVETETMEEVTDGNSGRTAVVNFPSNSHDLVAGNSYNDEKPAGNLSDNELCRQGEFEGDINNEDVNHGSLDDEPYPPGGLDSNSSAGARLDTEMAVEDLTLEIVDKTISREAPNPIHTSKEESNYHFDRNADKIKSEAMNVEKISVVEENANLEKVNRKLPEGHTKIEDPPFKSESIISFQEIPALLNTPKEEPDSQNDKVADNIKSKIINVDKILVPKEDLQQEVGTGKLPKAVDGSAGSTRMEFDAIEKDENREQNDLNKIFEPGCVFVQYRRTEASCMAAHSIHGRLFDNRVVTVEYINPNLYRVKFPK
ncbi:U2af2 [Gossypium arboreum]|uniref:U2af2 n=1 Tax=Gossypium arboreum TaxID=29729 RepID=A0A0B0NAM1_GOSAR|nr:U2af2 [Gossypium arboreum]